MGVTEAFETADDPCGLVKKLLYIDIRGIYRIYLASVQDFWKTLGRFDLGEPWARAA
jgi:hypothetical protein